ncbi:acyl-CoA reductase [Zeaxanthinibacter enoshimensis]|uniref:Acyl-CoA reductase LuxC n=1 Tax=Zeaxanthinibacter enoshimensis TaxID=392009 RepID=A0A4R6TPF0_9FLAO|nr:acyl-CoA reductase [Zeaxanthinibacter enoshimensis]TDQ31495.1 acyl-CoA reductase LuxC [Zeaxanthinibacter enoshimensis]
MGDHSLRLKAFVKLGAFFREFISSVTQDKEHVISKDGWISEFQTAITLASQQNPWFTEEFQLQAIENWGEALKEESLQDWLAAYPRANGEPKRVALIMAGNIPLVGFHDFLSALITGNSVLVKLSSKDKILFPFIAKYLEDTEPSLKDAIEFTDGRLTDYDAVIATGSNNSARYFEYYFGGKPNIIRRNRNSVAILDGTESEEELKALGRDIFDYFGMGCRNVSKLYVPQNYQFDKFYESIECYSDVLNHTKYANNYDYNKAVYLMSEFPILDNGFLLLKEDSSYSSPIGTVFYERYRTKEELNIKLEQDKDQIQCIVSNSTAEGLPLGKAQSPGLSDYADGIDTVEFMLKITHK